MHQDVLLDGAQSAVMTVHVECREMWAWQESDAGEYGAHNFTLQLSHPADPANDDKIALLLSSVACVAVPPLALRAAHHWLAESTRRRPDLAQARPQASVRITHRTPDAD